MVGIPDQRLGETIRAYVVAVDPASPPDVEALHAYCRQTLAGFKVPKTVVFGPLPKTSTGKVQKYVLRTQAAALDGKPA